MLHYAIGVDPGAESGLALVSLDDETNELRVLYARTEKVPSVGVNSRARVIANALRERESHRDHPVAFLVEAQFVGMNPHSAIKTVESAVSWLNAADALMGCGCVVFRLCKRVPPQSWGSTFGMARLRSAARKRVSPLVVEKVTGYSPSTHNEADSILIAAHYLVSSHFTKTQRQTLRAKVGP